MKFDPTPEQQSIYSHQQGLAKVFAGPGTGKTTTLIEYVARLSQVGFSRILVLCYNKEVRKEIASKLQSMQIKSVSVHTFHSLAFKELKFKQQQKDTEKTQRLLQKQVLQKILQGKNPSQEALDEFAEFVAAQKAYFPVPEMNNEPLAKAYYFYEQQRKAEGWQFFDDWLQSYAQKLMINGAPFFDAVMVDEAQDLNPIQFSIFEYLSTHAKVGMLVGDVDQTLYQWRQAKPDMFLKFSVSHLPSHDYKLSYTFRYGHQQALAAQQLIHQNINRHPLLTVSKGLQQTSISLQEHVAPINHLVSQINTLNKSFATLPSIAVIAPNWAALEAVQIALILKRIPYKIKEDKRLKMHDGFSLLTALAIICRDDYSKIDHAERASAIECILITPAYAVSMEQIKKLANEFAHLTPDNVLEFIDLLQQSARKPLNSALTNLRTAIKQKEFASQSAEKVLLSYYQETNLIEQLLQDRLLSEDRRNEKCFHYQQLLLLAQKKDQPLAEFASFIKGVFSTVNTKQPSNIVLGTVHFHKGLEYDHVFVMAGDSWGRKPNELQESERRSLYVAITRAKISTNIITEKGAHVAELMQLEQADQSFAALDTNSFIKALAKTGQEYLEKWRLA